MYRYYKIGPLYDNCLILAPDNQPLTRCQRSKMQRYLSQDKAEAIDGDTIRLKFEPSCREAAEIAALYKENRCCVCGATEKLSIHHIVPEAFLKYFPISWKRCSVLRLDAISVCITCHIKYEKKAVAFKSTLASLYGITDQGYDVIIDNDKGYIGKRCKSLLRRNLHPKARQNITEDLRERLGFVPSAEQLQYYAANYATYIKGPNYKPCGQYIVENMNLHTLIMLWRVHFLQHAQPQFMPSYWNPLALPS